MNNSKTMTVPVKVGMRGDVSYTVRDSVTGKIKQQKQIRNTLLAPHYLDRIFTQTTPSLLAWGSNTSLVAPSPKCRVGTGTTPPTVDDTQLENEQAVVNAVLNQQSKSAEGVNPVTHSQLFRFAAGTFVGTITEVGLSAVIAGADRLIARQIVSPGIVLAAEDELDIRWTISVNFGTQTFTGTIVDGQRGGGDVNWTLTINDAQMMTLVQRTTSANVATSSGASNALFRLYSETDHPFIRVGDSNAASDLANDGQYDIKGSELFAGTASGSLKSSDAYVPGSFLRDVTIGLEHDAPENTLVGEMVIGSFSSGVTSESYGGLCRVTFDPKLDKATSFRLFVKFVFGLVLDTET